MKLFNIIKPPDSPNSVPSAVEWKEAEEILGFRFPADYKRLIQGYGIGSFDNFLWPLVPNAHNRNLDLIVKGKLRLESVLASEDESLPYELHPASSGLYPWAITDNGDTLYWLRTNDIEKWSLVINESRGPRWQRFDMLTTEFLEALFCRKIHVEVFPDDFPSDTPCFQKY